MSNAYRFIARHWLERFHKASKLIRAKPGSADCARLPLRRFEFGSAYNETYETDSLRKQEASITFDCMIGSTLMSRVVKQPAHDPAHGFLLQVREVRGGVLVRRHLLEELLSSRCCSRALCYL